MMDLSFHQVVDLRQSTKIVNGKVWTTIFATDAEGEEVEITFFHHQKVTLPVEFDSGLTEEAHPNGPA